jgi:hypothetical protein
VSTDCIDDATCIITGNVARDADSDGDFDEATETIYTMTADGETIVAAGTLARYVPNADTKKYGKLKITTTEDLSAKTVSAVIEKVSR